MTPETIHITAMTAADRLSQVIAATSKAVDDGRGYTFDHWQAVGLWFAIVKIEPAQVTP